MSKEKFSGTGEQIERYEKEMKENLLQIALAKARGENREDYHHKIARITRIKSDFLHSENLIQLVKEVIDDYFNSLGKHELAQMTREEKAGYHYLNQHLERKF